MGGKSKTEMRGPDVVLAATRETTMRKMRIMQKSEARVPPNIALRERPPEARVVVEAPGSKDPLLEEARGAGEAGRATRGPT